jgi:hypothetical protein
MLRAVKYVNMVIGGGMVDQGLIPVWGKDIYLCLPVFTAKGY